jgi:hypothetical protein
MIPHLAVTPSDFARASELLRAAARKNAGILVLDRGTLGTLLVFCRDGVDAQEVEKGWRVEARIPAGFSTIEVAPSAKLILLHQEGTEESRSRLVAFFKPLMPHLHPYGVADADSGEDVATAGVARLFGDEDEA